SGAAGHGVSRLTHLPDCGPRTVHLCALSDQCLLVDRGHLYVSAHPRVTLYGRSFVRHCLLFVCSPGCPDQQELPAGFAHDDVVPDQPVLHLALFPMAFHEALAAGGYADRADSTAQTSRPFRPIWRVCCHVCREEGKLETTHRPALHALLCAEFDPACRLLRLWN